jgi:hypothetical protein
MVFLVGVKCNPGAGGILPAVPDVESKRAEAPIAKVSVRSKTVFMSGYLAVSVCNCLEERGGEKKLAKNKEPRMDANLHRSVSPVASLPLAAEQSVEERVLELAFHVPTFTEKSFTLKAESFERANRCNIARVHVGFEPAQLHDFKGVRQQSL